MVGVPVGVTVGVAVGVAVGAKVGEPVRGASVMVRLSAVHSFVSFWHMVYSAVYLPAMLVVEKSEDSSFLRMYA